MLLIIMKKGEKACRISLAFSMNVIIYTVVTMPLLILRFVSSALAAAASKLHTTSASLFEWCENYRSKMVSTLRQ